MLHKLANIGHQAIKDQTGKKYRIGSVASVLHRAAGGSIDYAYGSLGIPYVICFEMSPGGSGFDPPKSQIQKLVHESWSGIRAMALHIKRKFAISINVSTSVKNTHKPRTKSLLLENSKICNQQKSRSSKLIHLKQDYTIRENMKENIASTYLISRTQPLKPTLSNKRQK